MTKQRSSRTKTGPTIKADRWNRFVSEALVSGDSDTNVKFPFKVMSSRYGLSYIDYCKAAWQANAGCLSAQEFMRINGGIPEGFFRKVVCAG